jgi:hypothetical protein
VSNLNISSASGLPYLYGKWISQLLEESIPEETVASCDSCAMCFRQDSDSQGQNFYFNPAIKCCTYIPELPNFLVGAILSSADSDTAIGRGSVTQRLTSGVGVTPLGLSPSPSYTLLYRNSPAAFGRNRALGCPHYVPETGRCSIWRYRAPPCITWFCKHNRGAVGRDFWRELHLLMVSIQQNVALWCMAKLEVDTEVMRAVVNQSQMTDAETNNSGNILDGKVGEDWLRSAWGNWYARREEFYQRCAHLAEGLEWLDVEQLCGPEVQIRAQIVKAAHHKLIGNELPTRLKIGNYQIVRTSEDYITVTTYSPYDPLDIPKQVLKDLASFNGRPLTEALDIITRHKNIPINSKVLRSLLDFGVLVEE